MPWVGVAASIVLIAVVLIDAFEVMILPRRVRHHYRPSRLFYIGAWFIWRNVGGFLPAGRWRSAFLSLFGPLSLLALIGLWAFSLIFSFALLHWSLVTPLSMPLGNHDDGVTLLYFSATTFVTLGYGDIVPTNATGRILSVLEAGVGFGFLALVISYLPIFYQAFSRREIAISLLDARAGSPPSAAEFLRRAGEADNLRNVGGLLAEWERWSAELLESHISFPFLSFYRSQHDNQSWIGALTAILDVSALLIACGDASNYQARLTFAMARHAAVDLDLVFGKPPLAPAERLAPAALERLRATLRSAGLELGEAQTRALNELRELYEPFVNALANYFCYSMPPLQPARHALDNWQTSARMGPAPGLGGLPAAALEEDHFEID